MRLWRERLEGGDEQALLRAATTAVARASGWTREQLEAGALEGSLCERQARAALEVVAEAGVYFLSADEARLLVACLGLLQQHQAHVVEGKLKYHLGSSTPLLEAALAQAQAVDALRTRVEAWQKQAERVEAERSP